MPARSAWRALAVVLLLAVAGVAAGCGSSRSSSTSSRAPADTSKAYKIGITQIVTHPALDAAVQGFKEALAEKGFTNVTYDIQNAQGDMATAASIAQKFAGENLDLILGVATPTTQAVVKAVPTTPIVFTAVTDPVGAGLVNDPKAPTGNVTGVSDMLPVQPILDLIKQLVPNVKTVGVIYNAGESNSVFLVKQVKAAAAPDGPHGSSRRRPATPPRCRRRPSRWSAAWTRSRCSPTTPPSRRSRAIVKVGEQNKIPLIAGDTDSVKRGAVAAYAFDYKDLGKQAGYQAAQILSGTPIKDIPVEYAKNLQLSINEKAAAAQGVTIPADLVSQAVNKF